VGLATTRSLVAHVRPLGPQTQIENSTEPADQTDHADPEPNGHPGCDENDQCCDCPQNRADSDRQCGGVGGEPAGHSGNVQYVHELRSAPFRHATRTRLPRRRCRFGSGGRCRFRGVIFRTLVTLLFGAFILAGNAHAAEPETVCRFSDDRLVEISGMARSQIHPNVLWLHNDSSYGPYLYAVDETNCTTLARIEIKGIDARDLEDIASGVDPAGRPVLWLGDIGDNRDSWPFVWVHRIREPAELVDQVVRARTYRFTYPDGSHDAEALMADPTSGQLWVVTKKLARGTMYALPDPLRPKRLNTALPLGQVGALVTGGAVSPDGTRYVLRDYVNAIIYEFPPIGTELARIDLPLQPQGEAVTWTADGSALLITSERDDRLIRVPIGDADVPPADESDIDVAEPTVTPPPDPSDTPWVAIGLGVAVSGVILVLAEIMRRRGARSHSRRTR
jgi:hypothetical protein